VRDCRGSARAARGSRASEGQNPCFHIFLALFWFCVNPPSPASTLAAFSRRSTISRRASTTRRSQRSLNRPWHRHRTLPAPATCCPRMVRPVCCLWHPDDTNHLYHELFEGNGARANGRSRSFRTKRAWRLDQGDNNSHPKLERAVFPHLDVRPGLFHDYFIFHSRPHSSHYINRY